MEEKFEAATPVTLRFLSKKILVVYWGIDPHTAIIVVLPTSMLRWYKNQRFCDKNEKGMHLGHIIYVK